MSQPSFIELKVPVYFVRGAAVKLARAALSTDYEDLPNITERGALRVGDEVYVMGLMGEVRLATIESVDGDRARASDKGVLMRLEFAKDIRKAWACPSMSARSVGWGL